jgi:Tol biopolymer transport system component
MVNQRAYRRAGCVVLTTALTLFGAAGSAHARVVGGVTAQTGGSCAQAGCFQLKSTIAVTTTPNQSNPMTRTAAVNAAEISLMNPGTTNPNPRPLTTTGGNAFANLSPDGKHIVFDHRLVTDNTCRDETTGESRNVSNISDLYIMDADGSNQRRLTRGSSATWSPDGKDIAFHASASYYASGGQTTACPINPNPGAAPTDSDIFVANVDDLLAGTAQPVDITNTQPLLSGLSEDDADWSVPTTGAPDGRIAFTAHSPSDIGNVFPDADIYVINPDGSDPKALPKNPNNPNEQLATPAWSPDGTRIVHECRVNGGMTAFQICVMNADGTNVVQLTNDFSVQNLSPTWSPDGLQILFGRPLPPVPPTIKDEVMNYQLFTINLNDNTLGEITCAPEQNSPDYPNLYHCPSGVTPTEGINFAGHWGVLRVKS